MLLLSLWLAQTNRMQKVPADLALLCHSRLAKPLLCHMAAFVCRAVRHFAAALVSGACAAASAAGVMSLQHAGTGKDCRSLQMPSYLACLRCSAARARSYIFTPHSSGVLPLSSGLALCSLVTAGLSPALDPSAWSCEASSRP